MVELKLSRTPPPVERLGRDRPPRLVREVLPPRGVSRDACCGAEGWAERQLHRAIGVCAVAAIVPAIVHFFLGTGSW